MPVNLLREAIRTQSWQMVQDALNLLDPKPKEDLFFTPLDGKEETPAPIEELPAYSWDTGESQDGRAFYVYKPYTLSSTQYNLVNKIAEAAEGHWVPMLRAFAFPSRDRANVFAEAAGRVCPKSVENY